MAKTDILDTVNFVDVMQPYRTATMADQIEVVRRFNNVKIFIRENFTPKEETFDNMQYYYEYCQANGYVTPQEWIENHKHF